MEPRIRVGGPQRPVRARHVPSRPRSSTSSATSCSRTRSTRATLDALDAALASGDDDVKRSSQRAPDGRFWRRRARHPNRRAARGDALASSPARFCAHAVLAGLARDLVGPDVRLYWDQSVYKQPNSAEPVLWHQDNGYTYVEPQAYLTCWIAITDATPDNGCIAVMPGVHRAARSRTGPRRSARSAGATGRPRSRFRCAPGASSCSPRSRPTRRRQNITDAVRKAYIVQYAPDGAVALHGDPDAGPPTGREVLGDDERRYCVVRDGVARRAAPAAP